MRLTAAIIIIITIGLSSACEELNDPILHKDEFLIIGSEESDIQLTQFIERKSVCASKGYESDSLDIDGDGHFDIAFYSTALSWVVKSSSVGSLHESTFLLVQYIEDSVFFCDDNNNPSLTFNPIYYNSNFEFQTFSDRDSLVWIQGYASPIILAKGDTLQFDDQQNKWDSNAWLSDTYYGGWNTTSESYNFENPFGYLNFGLWNDIGEKYL